MRPRKGAQERRTKTISLELEVSDLARGGEGVALIEHEKERRAVFVPRAMIGDVIVADVDFSTRPARARVVELMRASSDRNEPRCVVAAKCGGCNWMHIAPAAQERELRRVVERATGFANVTMHAPVTSATYRCRARVSIEAKGNAVSVGFFGERSKRIVELESCAIMAPPIAAAFARLPDLFRGAKGTGEVRLALGPVGESRAAVAQITFAGELPPSFFGTLEKIVASGVLVGAEVELEGARAPLVFGNATPFITGGDDLPLEIAKGGFSQASEEGNAALSRLVAKRAAELIKGRAKKIVELYAGAGTLTVLLAPLAEKLTAVESHAGSVSAARKNLARREFGRDVRKIEMVLADADTFELARGIDLLVLDPPRTGAKEVATRVAAAKPKGILYVSCDPATLARDLAILAEAHYEITSVDALLLFPETSHVETIVSLVPAQRSAGQTS